MTARLWIAGLGIGPPGPTLPGLGRFGGVRTSRGPPPSMLPNLTAVTLSLTTEKNDSKSGDRCPP
jgi:hypothetical protein